MSQQGHFEDALLSQQVIALAFLVSAFQENNELASAEYIAGHPPQC